MVKSVSSVYHQGLQDWAIQRVSAIGMLIYILFLFGFFLSHRSLSYFEWHMLFSYQVMKIATFLFLIAMVYHAWIGMWTIFTDYIKPTVLRIIANLIVLLTLAASLIWGVMILWSV
ncbi:MAG: succinate dehydrogenase, hydrophobic membrane anchor protein [Gammaproteobacteria bacterium]|nr:succinate dehydrogenase, hydrophobic membrane anchor protein [Gammaproteobacteria bacterium]